MKDVKHREGKRIVKMLLLANVMALSAAFAQKDIGNAAPEANDTEAALSFRDIPDLKEAFIDAAPIDRKDGISVGKLGTNGGNKAMILKLAQEIADSRYGNFDSYLIAYKGKLIFESYFSRGRINLPHPQASATKAYTSLALGRAIQLGYLSMADLHKPLISFLKDLNPTKFVEGVEKITLHKALTMRSGIRISEEQREEFKKKPSQLRGQGQVQIYLEHSAPITSASQRFKYQFDPMLVMQVIEAVVPGTAKDFIKKELLDKMGITNYEWGTEISGLPKSGSGTSMTSRDMVKWGTLAINKGKWNDEQLVPAAFITKSTSKIVDQSDEYDDIANGVSGTAYGYFWWQADLSAGGKSYLSKAARGGSGQNIIVIEALDLVVVTTTHRPVDDVTSVTATGVLPAFIEHPIPSMSGKSDSQDKGVLKERYLGQKPPGLTPEVFAPGIVSTKEHLETEVLFLPDLTELSFTRSGGTYKEPTLFVMQYKKNRWSRKSIPSTDIDQYKERFSPNVSEIKSFEPFKDIPIVGFTISSKGTFYFYVLDFKDGSGHMSYSRLIDGKYEEPQKLNKAINRGKYIAHPFIAPDESYLMWDAEKEGENTPDIYISFRKKDGSWGEAINMGDKINSALYEQRPKVTPDGKYLFFWKGDVKVREDGSRYVIGSPYWVDAQIIENLRPQE